MDVKKKQHNRYTWKEDQRSKVKKNLPTTGKENDVCRGMEYYLQLNLK